jgi:hypothetical protein
MIHRLASDSTAARCLSEATRCEAGAARAKGIAEECVRAADNCREHARKITLRSNERATEWTVAGEKFVLCAIGHVHTGMRLLRDAASFREKAHSLGRIPKVRLLREATTWEKYKEPLVM